MGNNCKRCGGQINYSRGWRCPDNPTYTCVSWSGDRYKSYNQFSTPKKENVVNINQLIESYVYARITGSCKPLDHLDVQAEKIILNTPKQIRDTLNNLFTYDEYEAKLRYLKNADQDS
jgi:hypothetical protein